jgi:hypothetical protein
MSTLGSYQNDIVNLPKLDLELYERIFKVYNTTGNDKTFQFYNILKKIEMPTNIDSNIVDFYTVQSSIPATTISYRIYQDIRLWWLIYLLNKDVIGSNIFVIPPGTQLKYIKPQFLEIVFNQITNLIVFNGRHF